LHNIFQRLHNKEVYIKLSLPMKKCVCKSFVLKMKRFNLIERDLMFQHQDKISKRWPILNITGSIITTIIRSRLFLHGYSTRNMHDLIGFIVRKSNYAFIYFSTAPYCIFHHCKSARLHCCNKRIPRLCTQYKDR